MSRLLLTSVVSLLLIAELRSQPDGGGVIAGTIASRESGEMLAGATIVLEGTVLGTSSSAEGGFIIRDAPAGSHTLLVSLVGFHARRLPGVMVRGADTTHLTIDLEPAPFQTQPVIVTASRHEEVAEDIPASVSIVDDRLLAYRNAITVDDALRYVPGVYVTQSQVNIRGSAGYSFGVGTRVLMLVDGLPFISGDTGEIIWESLPATQIDRIEVVKGAASALYGSSALGGVVNIITKSASETPETGLRLYGGMYDLPKYQTWKWTDEMRFFSGVHVSYARRIGDFNLATALDRSQNDGYRQNDYRKRWNGSARLGLTISPYQSAGVSFSILEQRRGNFLYWRDFDHAFQPKADQLAQSVYSVRWNLSGGYRNFLSDQFLCSARFSWFRSRWDDNIPSQYDSAGSNSRSDNVTGELQGDYRLSPNHTLIVGFAGSLENVDADTIFGRHTGRGGAVYLQDEIGLPGPMRFTLGGGFDYQQIGGLEPVSQFNPKLGLVYRLPDSSAVRFSAGRGFRAPSVAEVFTTSTAGGVVILPNPDLKPERSWSLDLGGSHTFNPCVHGDISIFRNEFWDLIEPAFGNDGVVHFQNITRALIYGSELTLNLSLFNGNVQSQVSYTYMVPRDVTTGDILKYRPRNLLYVSTQLDGHPFRLGVDLRILSRTEQIDDDFVTLGIIPQGDQRVPIYVADLRIGADWAIGGLPMTSALHINNLFQYYYVELIGNMAPTRNFVFTLETRI